MALKWDGLQFDESRVDFFFQCVHLRIRELLEGPVSDNVKVFIKQEPHKRSKLDEQRYRLISSVSAIDTMVDRLLYQEWVSKIVSHYSQGPIMVGWSPVTRGAPLVLEKVGAGPYLNVDKSSWDWTTQPWLLELVHDVIAQLAVNPHDTWTVLHDNRFSALFNCPTFQTSDGQFFVQPEPGVVKSGMYLTTLYNSLAQVVLHELLCELMEEEVPLPVFIGDDAIQADFPLAEVYYSVMQHLGFRVKVYRSDSAEFAGAHLGPGFAFIPEHVEKNFFNLAHTDNAILPAALTSYQLLYYHDAGLLSELRRMCVESGFSHCILPPSRAYEILS